MTSAWRGSVNLVTRRQRVDQITLNQDLERSAQEGPARSHVMIVSVCLGLFLSVPFPFQRTGLSDVGGLGF